MFKENRLIFSRLGSVGSGRTSSGGSGGGVNSSGQRTSSYDSSGGAIKGQDPGLLSAAASMMTTAEGRDSAINELKSAGLWQEPTSNDYKNLTNSGKADTYKTQIQQNIADQYINSQAEAFDYIDEALKNGTITADEAALFKDTVRNWDINQELNMDNVLKEFNRIKTETIDPQFAEKVDIFTKGLEQDLAYQADNRARELEQEKYTAQKNIENTQAGLEQAGLTFSGQGIKELGKESAFAQQPTTGVKIPFGGTGIEGTVPMANRLMSTSSSARYQNALNQQGLGAEEYLGSNRIGGFNFGGYNPVGGAKGSLYQTQQGAYANALSQLAGQNRQNTEYQQPVDFNFS